MYLIESTSRCSLDVQTGFISIHKSHEVMPSTRSLAWHVAHAISLLFVLPLQRYVGGERILFLIAKKIDVHHMCNEFNSLWIHIDRSFM